MSGSGSDFGAMLTSPPAPEGRPSWRTGSRIDDWWSSRSPRTRNVLRWSAPVGVMVTAVLTRLVGLGHPSEIVFDETYYVKDAWSTWNLGYEGTWPSDPTGADDRYWADRQFEAGQTDIFLPAPSFAVHPPLGKWLIALGMAVMGPSNPFGWRLAVAIAGILLVGLTMLVAYKLTRSLLVASFAGGLLAIDGNGIVMSRISLLDGFVALFGLLGFYFVLLDRERTRRTGALWARPWLIAAGAALGAAGAIKWSGIWFLVFFGVWTVVADAMDRRNASELPRRIGVNFLLMVPIAAAVYLASWAGWFSTDGGYYRNWAADGDHAWTGFWSWVPLSVQSFLHQQGEVYRFHSELRTDHPYKSPAWAWLLLIRPTAIWYRGTTSADDPSCGSSACGSLVTDLPNPLIWYASIAAIIWLIVVAIRRRDWAAWAVVIGFAAGWAPWMLLLERTTYFFYSMAYQPFLLIALAMAMKAVLGRPEDERSRRRSGILAVSMFLVVAVAMSIFFWPVWTGQTLDISQITLRYWSVTWV